jgi:hypothetical protein
MLVGAVDTSAGISKLAGNLRVNVQTLISVGALGEELALLRGVVIFTLLSREVALGPVLASDLALGTALVKRFL